MHIITLQTTNSPYYRCLPVVYQIIGENIQTICFFDIAFNHLLCIHIIIFDLHNSLEKDMQDSYFNSHFIDEETEGQRSWDSVLFLLQLSFRGGQGISLMPFVYWTKSCDSKLKLPSFWAYQTLIFKPPSYFWRNSLLCDPTRKAKEDSPCSLETGTWPRISHWVVPTQACEYWASNPMTQR